LPHQLIGSHEIYIFTEGNGKIFIKNESQKIKSGDMVVVPPGATQHVENLGSADLQFYCIVSPPWKEENDVLID